jgi:hypothetical protein
MHPWNGGSVGHQIVINGFTWNRDTHEGTFHIVNSWKELPEFDLKTEMARGAMDRRTEPLAKGRTGGGGRGDAQVTKVVLIRSIGKTNLYEVETSTGVGARGGAGRGHGEGHGRGRRFHLLTRYRSHASLTASHAQE